MVIMNTRTVHGDRVQGVRARCAFEWCMCTVHGVGEWFVCTWCMVPGARVYGEYVWCMVHASGVHCA